MLLKSRSKPPARVRNSLLVAPLLLAFWAVPAQAGPLFAPDSVWNSQLDPNAPLASNSGALVTKLNSWVSAEEQQLSGPWINTTSYSAPIYTVASGAPTTDVVLDKFSPALNTAFQDVPVPANAQAAAGTDQHMVVVQPSSDTMWEFWKMRQQLPVVASLKGSPSSGGSLPAARYLYAVSALSSKGETTVTPASGLGVSVAAGGRVTLSWGGVVGATGYRVYRGTTTANMARLATVNQATTAYRTTVSYVDNGSVTPSGARPTANTANTPGIWHAGWGGRMLDVSEHPGYYHTVFGPAEDLLEDPSWGATASSLPMAGGLMRISELQAGHIDHAIDMELPDVKAGSWVWPAQRTDGSDTSSSAIPMGAHFRLDPALDLNSLSMPPFTRMVAEAAQNYGLIVNDRTYSVVTLRAEDPTPLMRQGQANPYPALFTDPQTGKVLTPTALMAKFPWNRLQLVP